MLRSPAREPTPCGSPTILLRTKKVSSALHGAVQAGRTDLVRYLLEKGANPELVDANGKKPIDLVSAGGGDGGGRGRGGAPAPVLRGNTAGRGAVLPPREPEVVAALGVEASARRLQPRFARCCKTRRRRSSLQRSAMISAIESLVDAFETRRLSRRELVVSLAALVAAEGSASAQAPPVQQISPVAQGRSINHVSLAVTDVERSAQFYSRLLGLKGGEPPRKWRHQPRAGHEFPRALQARQPRECESLLYRGRRLRSRTHCRTPEGDGRTGTHRHESGEPHERRRPVVLSGSRQHERATVGQWVPGIARARLLYRRAGETL